jgi:UDP-N-acetylmuramoylalanine--D-glutamate ligase
VADNTYDYLVLELSSFQLDDMHESRINYAVLMNITPDHLDRYATMEDYITSKFRITQNQTADDAFIYCADDTNITDYMAQHPLAAKTYPFSLDENIGLVDEPPPPDPSRPRPSPKRRRIPPKPATTLSHP